MSLSNALGRYGWSSKRSQRPRFMGLPSMTAAASAACQTKSCSSRMLAMFITIGTLATVRFNEEAEGLK